jgi:hypothetical protein
MKKLIISLFVSLWLIHPATAQQPTPTPTEQALSGKLQDEINQDMQVRQILMQTNVLLTQAKARIKELEDKYEKKSDASKKP